MWPPWVASERSWRRANLRPRPSVGTLTPAHMPSAPGVFSASLAHRHRRGHARHSALSSGSSPPAAHRSGSPRHGGVVTDSGLSIITVTETPPTAQPDIGVTLAL